MSAAVCGKGIGRCGRGTRCVKGACIGAAARSTRKSPSPRAAVVAAAAACGKGIGRCGRGTRCVKGACVGAAAAAARPPPPSNIKKSPQQIHKMTEEPPAAAPAAVETLPTLYGKTSNGKVKVWAARIISESPAAARYEIEHGQEGGKMQLTVREFTGGKNVGRKNETSPLEQCRSEITKKWSDKQKKEGYKVRGGEPAAAAADEDALPPPPSAAADIPRPMLAQTYKRDKTSIIFPCFVQPKIDGLRCLVYRSPTGDIITQSRTGGFFEQLDHIRTAVAPFFEIPAHRALILDGELYTTEIPFETLAGLIKKKKNLTDAHHTALKKVQYHIYDYIDRAAPKLTFEDRAANLRAFEPILAAAAAAATPIVMVATYEVATPTEFTQRFQEFVAAGYEGIMLRNKRGAYRENVRSVDLQKYKEFEEEEYTIVGYTQGDGRDKGTVIWICETAEGRRFNVRPRGTVESRRELFDTAEEYVGQKLTVIFQELSEYNVPRFPVGKDVRVGY